MADRYSTLSFSQAVGAGSSVTVAKSLTVSSCNIVKIKIVPTILTAPTEFYIYKDLTYAAADLAYATKEYTGFLIDPCEDDGSTQVERNEGFVCAYEDKQDTQAIYFKIVNNHTASVTYTVTILYDAATSGSDIDSGIPEGLNASALPNGNDILFKVWAARNADSIDLGELRLKFIAAGDPVPPSVDMRTVAEGGTFADNGSTQLIISNNYADRYGSEHILESAGDGVWFFAWKLHNSVEWSAWTDGNMTPSEVTDWIKTDASGSEDTAPPADWIVTLEYGPVSNTVICKATRPDENSNIINNFIVQILDADTGSWRSLLQGSDTGHLKHDGRSISYSLLPNRNGLVDATASGYGTAAAGDLCVIDVRGGAWDEQHVLWATVSSVVGDTVYFEELINPQVTSDLRMIIIKHPIKWQTNGYLGGTTKRGWYPGFRDNPDQFLGDKNTSDFISSAISIPAAVTNPEARVWFQNGYSRADNNMTHSSGLLGLPSVRKWTNLNDRNWFIPHYGNLDYATADFDSSGNFEVECASPPPATPYMGNFWGLKTRFLIYPDLSGIIKVRAKFENVILPQGSTIYHTNALAIAAINRMAYNTYSTLFQAMAAWGQKQSEANLRFGSAWMTPSNEQLVLSYDATADSVARPSPGYSLDLYFGLSENPAQNYRFTNTLMQYSLNGGAITNVSSMNYDIMNPVAATGLEFYLGFFLSRESSGASYDSFEFEITEFEVIQGIIAPARGQGGVNIPIDQTPTNPGSPGDQDPYFNPVKIFKVRTN